MSYQTLNSSSWCKMCPSRHSLTVWDHFRCSAHVIELTRSGYGIMFPSQLLCCENHKKFHCLYFSKTCYTWDAQWPSFRLFFSVYVHRDMHFPWYLHLMNIMANKYGNEIMLPMFLKTWYEMGKITTSLTEDRRICRNERCDMFKRTIHMYQIVWI